jgi:copper chaperone
MNFEAFVNFESIAKFLKIVRVSLVGFFLVSFSLGLACEGMEGKQHQCSTKKGGHHGLKSVVTESGVIEMKVSGMACASCLKRLETALKSVKGVKKATISLEKQVARIEVADANLRTQLEAVAKAAGFVPEETSQNALQ